MKAKEVVVFGLIALFLSISFVSCEDVEENGTEDTGGDAADEVEPEVSDENGVLVLTDKNFDSVIKKYDTILVEFYAPWCGHCKELTPKYEAAAMTLKAADPPVPLAKVDATVEKEIGERFEIGGFPTLKFFKKGKPYDYDGERTEDAIVKFMKEKADPSWEAPPEAVVTLGNDNFTEFIQKELVLVEFYAPWCGHCKRLAPEYEKAAQDLIKLEPPVMLGKVDATVESELANKYGVDGYPALKIFRRGKEFEYKGGRDKWGIVSYMQRQVGDASMEQGSLKDMKTFFRDDDITIVGFFTSKEDTLYQAYMDAANGMRDDYLFIHTFSSDVADHYKVNQNAVAVFMPERFQSKHERRWYVYDHGRGDERAIKTFVEEHHLPLAGQYSQATKDRRYKDKRPLVLFFYTVDWSFDHRDATNMWRKKVADIAKDYRDMTFAIADEDEFGELMKEFGFDESSEDMNIGILGDKERKYPMSEMEEFDSDDIREFLNKFKKGSLKPKVKSQAVPKRDTALVKTVVGKSFRDIVFDSSKDVLIELYAPWCGHCKQLEPIYKKLAKKYKDDQNLVIAKMDATANDAPTEYSSEGFPTIYFAPSNNKEYPLKYNGERDLESMSGFIEQHATVSLGKGGKEEL